MKVLLGEIDMGYKSIFASHHMQEIPASPTTLTPDGTMWTGSDKSPVIIPARAEKAGALQREELLKSEMAKDSKIKEGNIQLDWKTGDPDAALEIADNLAQELDEDQIEKVLTNFQCHSEAKGSAGYVAAMDMDPPTRFRLFTMLEEMVSCNRKKVNAEAETQPAQPAELESTLKVVETKDLAAKPKEPTAEPVEQPEASEPKPTAEPSVEATQLEDTSSNVEPSVEPAVEPPASVQPEVATEAKEEPTPAVPPASVQPEVATEAKEEPKPAVPPASVQLEVATEAKEVPKPAVPPASVQPEVPAKPAAVAPVAAVAPNPKPVDKNAGVQQLPWDGLQALMSQHKQRQAQEASQMAEPMVVNWSTHRKEGMRLKRLMEESSQGANYPHMKKLFTEGSKEAWDLNNLFFFDSQSYMHI